MSLEANDAIDQRALALDKKRTKCSVMDVPLTDPAYSDELLEILPLLLKGEPRLSSRALDVLSL